MDQYVNSALEKAGQHLEPALKTAKETVTKAHKTIREDVMPEISRAGSKAYEHVSDTPKHMDKAHSVLHNVVSPLFDTVHRVSPEQAKQLPRHPVDRLLLIIVILFVLYHTSGIIVRLIKLSKTLTNFSLWITGWLLYLFVKLPLKIVRRVVFFWLWLGTFFGCCGLCCRQREKKDNGKEPGSSKSAVVKDVTVDEVAELLAKAQKEGKLQACAKQLADGAKKDKVLTTGAPKLKGKKVPKDVLKKAFSKYKDLDVKKLGL